MFAIINDHGRINPETLFGKETEKVDKLCNQIMWNELDGFSKKHPAWTWLHEHGIKVFDVKHVYGVHPIEWRRQWEESHPAETESYEAEKTAWFEANQKLFRQLYGIAKRRHLRIEWNGNSKSVCMPDRFDIYKNGKRIAMIQC